VYSYDQLDRTMKTGETVRIDLGCANHGYGGDVGRTVPVSGKFTAGQREIWNLLIDAYRAGMRAMKPGVSIAQVMATSRAEIERQSGSLETAEGRDAARILLAPDGMSGWSIHSVGVESGETPLQTLVAGAVASAVLVVFVQADSFAQAFDHWMASILVWISPWAAIVLVDFFVLRRGRIDVAALYRDGGANPRALSSLAVGLLSAWAWQFGTVPALQGPIARALGHTDFSWLSGGLVAGGLYYALERRAHRKARRAAPVEKIS